MAVVVAVVALVLLVVVVVAARVVQMVKLVQSSQRGSLWHRVSKLTKSVLLVCSRIKLPPETFHLYQPKLVLTFTRSLTRINYQLIELQFTKLD